MTDERRTSRVEVVIDGQSMPCSQRRTFPKSVDGTWGEERAGQDEKRRAGVDEDDDWRAASCTHRLAKRGPMTAHIPGRDQPTQASWLLDAIPSWIKAGSVEGASAQRQGRRGQHG